MQRKNNGRKRQRQRKARLPKGLVIRRPEVKHHDVANFTINMVSAGAVKSAPLNGILNGNTDGTRVGDKIHVHKVSYRGFIQPTDVTDSDDVVRIIFFQDKQASATTPTMGQILETVTVSSFRQKKRLQRFVILADFFVMWNAQTLNVATSGFAKTRIPIEFFKNVDFETHYISDAATFAGISTNSIGVATVSLGGDATTMIGTSRIAYTDV